MNCAHPLSKRWQYQGAWMCCLCLRYFWGPKAETPTHDITGLPTVRAPHTALNRVDVAQVTKKG